MGRLVRGDPVLEQEQVTQLVGPGEDHPARDDANWMKHSLAWVYDAGQVRFDFRPVERDTRSGEVEAIPPQVRVY